MKDLVNQVFGPLTVIDISLNQGTSRRAIKWDCLCLCGKTVSVYSNDLQRSKRVGCSKTCAVIKNKKADNIKQMMLKKYGSSVNHSVHLRYSRCKADARSAGREFFLSREQFSALVTGPCKYCTRTFSFVGIDRVDNSLGYIQGNCVSCCEQCNRMKLDYTHQEFIDQCKLIASSNP